MGEGSGNANERPASSSFAFEASRFGEPGPDFRS